MPAVIMLCYHNKGVDMHENKLREFRERKGLSQARLAVQVGVHPLTVYLWERGDHLPSYRRMKALERVLGVPAEVIWPELIG